MMMRFVGSITLFLQRDEYATYILALDNMALTSNFPTVQHPFQPWERPLFLLGLPEVSEKTRPRPECRSNLNCISTSQPLEPLC